ncbi:MAG TPA: hypothetical protein VJL29_07520 [Thermoguttaceae bacterium]|nr:hypothetical protein [Thermoguttaceae bacterium]
MSTPSRSAQFTKLHKVLKKHYKPAPVVAERPVLEHLVFACLLEDARYDVAEETFATIMEEYFDWNEIRVSSIRELTETMARLPDPRAAATRLKRSLQHVFEANYSFDLEGLRKKNLGPAADAVKKIDGATPFGVAYVVQSALAGHSIPLDAGTLEVMRILGIATDKEVETASIAGLERAIPKNKGVEFGSLLHQLGADFTANPFATDVREKLTEIEPEAKKRWPKRGGPKKPAAEGKNEPADKKAGEERPAKPAAEEPKVRATKKKGKDDAAKKPAAEKARKSDSPRRKDAPSTSKSPETTAGKKKTTGGLSKRKPR